MPRIGSALALLTLTTTAPALAEAPRFAAPVFSGGALDDTSLAAISGRMGIAPLSAGAVKAMVDDNGRSDLRQTGSVGRIQMDVWWSSTGSELIAQSVRAAAR